ncbi:hypothetical protein [Streptomyces sp. NPDC048419]|uniref:hypothetical protein n=1 Tax=Streptomyces sp. NPDC048419 TaxID=3365547 RepID=UPI0037165175
MLSRGEVACASTTDRQQIAPSTACSTRQPPSPMVERNQAIALAMADGPAVGLRILDQLQEDRQLTGSQLLPAARAELLRRLGRTTEAVAAYDTALALAQPGRTGLPPPPTHPAHPTRTRNPPMTPDELFDGIAADLARQGATAGAMFGKRALKIHGRVFACLKDDYLAFKLGDGTSAHAEALALAGAELFDPSGIIVPSRTGSPFPSRTPPSGPPWPKPH